LAPLFPVAASVLSTTAGVFLTTLGPNLNVSKSPIIPNACNL